MKLRSLETVILKDLKARKMVFLAGPRQCGKTTLAKKTGLNHNGVSFNWDIDEDRALLQRKQIPESNDLWIFDELHKFRRWRNWLKGVYDQHGKKHSILVTGSANLDLYSRGGDSLQGRYNLIRMHPFTYGELLGGFRANKPGHWLKMRGLASRT